MSPDRNTAFLDHGIPYIFWMLSPTAFIIFCVMNFGRVGGLRFGSYYSSHYKEDQYQSLAFANIYKTRQTKNKDVKIVLENPKSNGRGGIFYSGWLAPSLSFQRLDLAEAFKYLRCISLGFWPQFNFWPVSHFLALGKYVRRFIIFIKFTKLLYP